MKERDFFKYMLKITKEGFLKSKTFEKYPEENWNYAICDTPIQKNKGLIFGLNWGGGDINAQTDYPLDKKERNWPFISHSNIYFKDFLDYTVDELNYSNLCFFRSPKVKQIVNSDWAIAIQLFKEYVEYIEPPWALMLGKPSHLWKQDIIKQKVINRIDKKTYRTSYGYSGLLFDKIPFGSVPHPQAHISTETRRELWQEVIKKMNLMKTEKTK